MAGYEIDYTLNKIEALPHTEQVVAIINNTPGLSGAAMIDQFIELPLTFVLARPVGSGTSRSVYYIDKHSGDRPLLYTSINRFENPEPMPRTTTLDNRIDEYIRAD